jgi:hypothetical protein
MQGKSERRAGKGAAAGQPAVQLARAEPAAQQANSAAAQPKGALYGILYNGEGNGVGREVPGAGKRTCDAPKGAGAVGDAPKTNASGSRLSSRVLHELSLNVPGTLAYSHLCLPMHLLLHACRQVLTHAQGVR